QVVMGFSLPSFGEHVTATLAMPRASAPEPAPTGVPSAVQDGPTEANGGSTAYRHFVEACAAEDRGDSDAAEHLFRLAVEREPRMAAALTNLGNLVYRQGELHEARGLYERALEHDPSQPEARDNTAQLLRGPREDGT